MKVSGLLAYRTWADCLRQKVISLGPACELVWIMRWWCWGWFAIVSGIRSSECPFSCPCETVNWWQWCVLVNVSCCLCVYVCVCVFTVGIRGVFEISGVAGLSAERRQKVYRPEVCVKCRYIVLFNSSLFTYPVNKYYAICTVTHLILLKSWCLVWQYSFKIKFWSYCLKMMLFEHCTP